MLTLKQLEERIARLEQLIPQLIIPLEKDIYSCPICQVEGVNCLTCTNINCPTGVVC